jgi:hypothetical protein
MLRDNALEPLVGCFVSADTDVVANAAGALFNCAESRALGCRLSFVWLAV